MLVGDQLLFTLAADIPCSDWTLYNTTTTENAALATRTNPGMARLQGISKRSGDRSAPFAAKVSLVDFNGDKIVAEIVPCYEVHSTRVADSRRQVPEQVTDMFSGKSTPAKARVDVTELARQARPARVGKRRHLLRGRRGEMAYRKKVIHRAQGLPIARHAELPCVGADSKLSHRAVCCWPQPTADVV